MIKVVTGFVVLLMLAACGGAALGPANRGDNGEAVCEEQSDWARSGTVDGGKITITCPAQALAENG